MSILHTAKDETAAEEHEDERFEKAHGTVMVIAWMVFASSAVLFARYGRSIRFGNSDTLLGEKIWYQIHRCIACLTTASTLLGFFLILVQTRATWVPSDEKKEFAHSVLGGIIVGCALVQAWMALFKCTPESSYRFIFNWLHRLTGLLAFLLSAPTIFIILETATNNRAGFIVILSLWSTWIVLIVVVLEVLRFLQQRSSVDEVKKTNSTQLYGVNEDVVVEEREADKKKKKPWNNQIIILFFVNFIVSVALAVPLIVRLWR